jgi:DNA-directed RNA polymerase subunit RPC12/RpoP
MFEPIRAGDVAAVQGPADPFPHLQLPQEPLVHCPECGSGLLYPLSSRDGDAAGEVECRCPECEHTGVVMTTPLVAAVWRRRSERASAAMWSLAEAITHDRAS